MTSTDTAPLPVLDIAEWWLTLPQVALWNGCKPWEAARRLSQHLRAGLVEARLNSKCQPGYVVIQYRRKP